jgi:hypothetical protein
VHGVEEAFQKFTELKSPLADRTNRKTNQLELKVKSAKAHGKMNSLANVAAGKEKVIKSTQHNPGAYTSK